MKKTEEALRGLTGCADLALSEETDAQVAERLEQLKKRLEDLAAELAGVQAELAKANEGKEAAEAGKRELEKKVGELELSAEDARKRALVGKAVSEGRVTNAQAKSLMGLSEQALGEFVEACPKGCAVPQGRAEAAAAGGCLALSAEEKELAARMGVSEDDVLAAKKNTKEE